jgi:16S rRNA (adenine1518-N6/adenine1519-N6)-dimethyltransferase
MEKHGFSFSGALGQNFLINPHVCPKIAELGSTSPENTGVLEIGAGIGVLTKELALRYKKVIVLEIDKGLKPILDETLAGFDNVEIIYADIMAINLKELITAGFEGLDAVCCANLPYYITSPVIMRLLDEDLPLKSITVMVQKEAADRITALPGTRECGAISIAIRYYGTPEKLFGVGRGKFMPSPNVDSTVIRIIVDKKYNLNEIDKIRFFRIVKSVFSQRRKQIINPLSVEFHISKDKARDILEKCGISSRARAEELSLDKFIALNEAIGGNL